MLEATYWLRKQLEPNKTRTHYISGYLPEAGNGDDSTNWKKQAHEGSFIDYTLLFHAPSPLPSTKIVEDV